MESIGIIESGATVGNGGGEGQGAACRPGPAAARSSGRALLLDLNHYPVRLRPAPFTPSSPAPAGAAAVRAKRAARSSGGRQNLLAKASRFRRPALLTLTLDRKIHGEPEEGHRTVTQNRFIPRLMRLLGVRVWVWVL